MMAGGHYEAGNVPYGILYTGLRAGIHNDSYDTKLKNTIDRPLVSRERHETRNYTPRFRMRCYAFPYIHRYFRLKSVVILSLQASVQTGIPVLYATVLILTDGLRIYCGNTSESKRIASSAPALFILVI